MTRPAGLVLTVACAAGTVVSVTADHALAAALNGFAFGFVATAALGRELRLELDRLDRLDRR